MLAGLRQLGISNAGRFRKFKSWDAIPSDALVMIRWRGMPTRDAYHWVVLQKLDGGGRRVLDPGSFAETLSASDTSTMIGVDYLLVDVAKRRRSIPRSASHHSSASQSSVPEVQVKTPQADRNSLGVTYEWSYPRMVARVFDALDERPPQKLFPQRFQRLLADLRAMGIEACLADDANRVVLAPDAASPGIEGKLRLRRMPPPRPQKPSRQGTIPQKVAEPVDPGALPKAPDILFGRYAVLSALMPGAMGEAFMVRDTNDGGVRFLKRVIANSANHKSLRREQAIYSKLLNHDFPHILGVHDWQSDEFHVGLVLEFADDGTLDDRLGNGAIDVQEMKAIATQVALGLDDLHRLEIVHRDIKPGNIVRHGGAWKLADFGIAKDTRVHGATTFKGAFTHGFAPPEQISGTEPHPSMDVYAYGKLITRMLTGTTDPDKIEDPVWVQLVRECTAREPNVRPPMAELLTRLQRM
jgi:serine/threonine protein kinase